MPDFEIKDVRSLTDAIRWEDGNDPTPGFEKPKPLVKYAVVDGNRKNEVGVRKAPLALVPPALVIRAAEAMGDGARKYGPYNWRQGSVVMSVYLGAVQRHLLAYQDGEDDAADSGHSHLSHIAATVAVILDAIETGTIVDDRSAGPAARLLAEQDRSGP